VTAYRILHITNSLGVGGAERLLVDLARLLDRDRFALSVCCTGRDGATRADVERAGAAVTVLDKRRRSSLLFPLFAADVASTFAAITGVIRRERPDLVHTHLEANYIAPFCARAAGVRAIVASFHSSVLLERRGRLSVRNAARRAVMRRVARTASALMAGSDFAAKAAAELCGVDQREVRVVYNAVDVSRIDAERPNDSIRSELGFPQTEKLVVTLGTVKEPKNHRLLVKAMRHVADRREDVSAVVIGSGPRELVAALEHLAGELGLQEKIRFLGYRDDAYGVVKACELMALPSLWEGLPVAALEGMACGVPVLLSDIPPHRELIEDGVDGWLFSSNDERAFAEGILAALESDETRAAVASAGGRKVRERFDAGTMVRGYESLYDECIRGA
jgi:glycosyltransferase involved in cell wall biosynthesis